MSFLLSAGAGEAAGDWRSLAGTAGRLLGLAAAPTFALMALLSAASAGGPMAVLCAGEAGHGLGGMTVMYLLMAAFHVPAWLRLVARGG